MCDAPFKYFYDYGDICQKVRRTSTPLKWHFVKQAE